MNNYRSRMALEKTYGFSATHSCMENHRRILKNIEEYWGFKNIRNFLSWNISHKKKNEILPLPATWMDLEDIVLSEISQIKGILYGITHVKSKKDNK